MKSIISEATETVKTIDEVFEIIGSVNADDDVVSLSNKLRAMQYKLLSARGGVNGIIGIIGGKLID